MRAIRRTSLRWLWAGQLLAFGILLGPPSVCFGQVPSLLGTWEWIGTLTGFPYPYSESPATVGYTVQMAFRDTTLDIYVDEVLVETTVYTVNGDSLSFPLSQIWYPLFGGEYLWWGSLTLNEDCIDCASHSFGPRAPLSVDAKSWAATKVQFR